MKELFKSQTSYEIINLLSSEPKKKYYPSDLAKSLNKDLANVTRELSKLKDEGIIIEYDGKKKSYALSDLYYASDELRNLFTKLRGADVDKKFTGSWVLAEDIPNICPFFSKLFINCFVDEFENPGGKAYQKVAAIHRDYHMWFYYDQKDAKSVGDHIVNRFVSEPVFMQETNKNIIKYADKLRKFASELPEERLDRISNEDLLALYLKHEDIHTQYYQWGWLPVAADMFGDNLTEKGKEILRNKGVKEDKINEYLTLLTQPTAPSLLKEEQDNFQNIGIKVQSNRKQMQLFQELFRKFKEEDVKEYGLYTHSPEYERKFEERVSELTSSIKPEIMRDLQKHYQKYFYTKFLFTEEQGVYSFEHYLKELVRLVNGDPLLSGKIKKEKKEVIALRKKQLALIKKIRLSSSEKIIFSSWGDFMVTKIYRRFAQIFASYRMVAVLEEAGRRAGLTLKETKFMRTEEIQQFLKGEKIDVVNIKRRVPFSVYYADKNENFFLVGVEAEKAAKLLHCEEVLDVKEIKGQCGCQGRAIGAVKIVNVMDDMRKVENGDILVAISTQPDLLPAMKKAAAFVTDQGGVTSHAAIVAREMNTPCVIGTKIASKVLKDGMKVEVDATRGFVRILG